MDISSHSQILSLPCITLASFEMKFIGMYLMLAWLKLVVADEKQYISVISDESMQGQLTSSAKLIRRKTKRKKNKESSTCHYAQLMVRAFLCAILLSPGTSHIAAATGKVSIG